MPSAPQRACGFPGCGEVSASGRCAKHRAARRNRGASEREPTAAERGYGRRWRNYRLAWLNEHSCCGDRLDGPSAEHSLCVADGIATSAPLRRMVVDHIAPHRGDETMFWDRRNHQTLCEPCHNRKTAVEDGGFVRFIPGERFVVTGAPGCGKTTWVGQRARPGDIVFDLDAVAGVVTQLPRYPRPLDATNALLAMRAGLLEWLAKATALVHVFVIVTDTVEAAQIAQRIGARVIQPAAFRASAGPS